MFFRLVPKSVTLKDLEQHNSPNLCVISPNSVVLGTDYVKVVEDVYYFCLFFSLFCCYIRLMVNRVVYRQVILYSLFGSLNKRPSN